MRSLKEIRAAKRRDKERKKLAQLGYTDEMVDQATAVAAEIDRLSEQYGLSTSEAVKLAIGLAEGKTVLPSN
jgi:hypothetical protein